MRRLPALVLFALLLAPPAALPCGGPNTDEIDCALHTLGETLHAIVWDVGGVDVMLRDEFRFLYPFGLTRGAAFDDLFRALYEAHWEAGGFDRQRRIVCAHDSLGNRSCAPEEGLDWERLLRAVVEKVTICNANGGACVDADPEALRLTRLEEAFDASVESRDWTRAEQAARRIVTHVLDLPAAPASRHGRVLNRALEYLELAPAIPAADAETAVAFFRIGSPFDPARAPKAFQEAAMVRDRGREAAEALLAENPRHVRAGTLRFVALQETIKRDVPDGWRGEIARRVPAATWERLLRAVDAWLADLPDHPLADLVGLLRVRLLYLKGDDAEAFAILRAIEPRHSMRAVGEMRYLVLQAGGGALASDLDVDTTDPALVTSLVLPEAPIPAARWTRLWQRAARDRSAPWSWNLQERLLAAAAREAEPGRPFPTGFPDAPDNPTQLWGLLRLVALVAAEQWPAARAQAASLRPTPDVARLAARMELVSGEAWAAAAVDGLPVAERRYLVRALLADDDLRQLVEHGPAAVRDEAAVALGIRAAVAGDWDRAIAAVRPVDPARADLWAKFHALGADGSASALLRQARLVGANRGRFWWGRDRAWDRAVQWRLARLEELTPEPSVPLRPGWTWDDERNAILRLLVADEAWLALRTLVAHLEAAPDSTARTAALAEANKAYNELLNYGPLSPFWTKRLADADTVARLRAIGRTIRAQR
ncbi:MAG TPA: hypothetical protein VKA21_09805 [Candidatus Binatia bacterium]|nr:hypothetical protein [Candidatus Binatia bacterium]